MKYSSFTSQQLAHEHSLNILNQLYEHNEFMESISNMVHIGCQNEALDLQWWANAVINDDTNTPLNIKRIGVNQIQSLNVSHTNPKHTCLLYTSPSPRDRTRSRMPSSA